jgi:hypothetical protein
MTDKALRPLGLLGIDVDGRRWVSFTAPLLRIWSTKLVIPRPRYKPASEVVIEPELSQLLILIFSNGERGLQQYCMGNR